MLTINGSQGEGGGQILRTALALSICLNKSFRIIQIRANRKRPGLQPQHLAAVNAAATVSQAEVEGADRDSQTLVFIPGKVSAGDFNFDIGTAGSTSLVLQTILPALMLTGSHSTLILEGGTHNPLAPPFEFLKYAFFPLVNQLGAKVEATLERPGFAPLGGGKIRVSIEPLEHLKPIEIMERGDIVQYSAEVLLANLPKHIAERELATIRDRLPIDDKDLHYSIDTRTKGAGNLVSIIIQSANVSECFTAFGKKGLPAERVAEQAVNEALHYLNADVPIGRHMADQFLLYIALTGSGRFITLQPSSHTLTNMSVIECFMGISIKAQQIGDDRWEIYCSS